MKKGYTHITVILDRTGSMESIRDDTIGGFNSFLEGQKASEGTATITLVQFDSQDPYEVIYRLRDVKEAPALTRSTYVPRASTPLLDAMGRGMNDLSAQMAAMDTADRPEHVLFVTITDGQENASREFTRADIVRMIDERKAAGWQFAFLSADLGAIEEAGQLGISADARLAYGRSARRVSAMYASLDSRVRDLRESRRHRLAFDDDDRKVQEGDEE